MNRRFILSAALLTPLLIAGCAVPEADQLFSSAGRFSLSGTDAQGKTFAASGRYDLRRRAGLTRLDLLTPLHGILARIEVTPDGASLTRSQDEPPVTAPDAETLMRGLLGFSFPVDALERWLGDTRSDFTEYGWRIRILQRFPDGSVKTVRASRALPAVTVTLAVDSRSEP